VTKRFGARYELREGGLVDHSLNIYLLDRNGNVAQTFGPGADAGEIAKALSRL
jgi:cytochrome oxidase Cu insertion factor (SCO1/SenC/PrrC family)